MLSFTLESAVAIVAVVCITHSSSSSSTNSSCSSDADSSAEYTIRSNDIPRATHEACHDLHLFKILPLTPEQLCLDMQLVQASYLSNPYHNKHHGADVVSKSAKTLQRDGASLKRRVMEAQCLTLEQWGEHQERRFALFQLAVILAAAMHDVLHPGYNNAYLKAIKHVMALTHTTAEQASVAFFTDIFLSQQHVLNCLSEEERQLVKEIITYAIDETDMSKHGDALKWQAAGELECFKHLAALIVHAADLANGADAWAVSKVWARWCNAEFHAQGDHSLRYHPELPVMKQFNRKVADVPDGQLFFITTFAVPTFEALEAVAPLTAQAGLQGCKMNAAICKVIMQRNKDCLLQRTMSRLGLGTLPRFL
ncbi:hypothetical protein OEZ85_006669 [Tetradesmus obliquus]|uniref:PDEase domain-containing protein n=1 Tax=Tetradesmus obliquus TaxID=3088 RepID=A0ABY8TVB6_TETOB|nr:hypothetical protein OEZ85_006669 [Tetradesmus obliquus]